MDEKFRHDDGRRFDRKTGKWIKTDKPDYSIWLFIGIAVGIMLAVKLLIK